MPRDRTTCTVSPAVTYRPEIQVANAVVLTIAVSVIE
jgi:hypothetical protein